MSIPRRIPIQLWLHRDIVTASPDGAEPCDVICFITIGTKRVYTDLVWIPKSLLIWLRNGHHMRADKRYGNKGKPMNEVLRKELERILSKPCEPIPWSRFDSMPDI